MPLSTREAYGKALVKFADTYDFIVMDADLSKATQTVLFSKEYPRRFFNMGIAEGNLMSTAAGAATCGKAVFASTFAVFAAGRAFEQIRNSIAYPRLNVKIAATHGGVLIGEDGGSHQAVEDISNMRTLPNMTVIVPCDEQSSYMAVKAAIELDGPVYLRFGRFATEDVYPEGNVPFEIGKGNLLREGSDVTVIAMGDMVCESLKAASILKKEGIEACVIDMHTVKPIDRELILEKAKISRAVVTAEDHSIIGGLGSAVAEVLSEKPIASLRRVGLNDCFGTTGSRQKLAEYFGLNAENIAENCRVAVHNK